MKVEEHNCLPDGIAIKISEIFVDTHEEKDEIIESIKNTLNLQRKKREKEFKNLKLVYNKNSNNYSFKRRKNKAWKI